MEAATAPRPTAPAGWRLHPAGKAFHCANCFGQYLDRRYVEFPAAFDGPVVNQIAVVSAPGVEPVAIDDLVLCEECVKVAAGMLGLERPSDLTQRVLELEAEVEKHRQAREDSEVALHDMHVAHRSLVRRRFSATRAPENVPDPLAEQAEGAAPPPAAVPRQRPGEPPPHLR
jgi:hypothetical protein